MKYAAYKHYNHREKQACGIEFTIDVNGHWYCHGIQNPGPIQRESLVKLFADKALKYIEGKYYLKTPYESYEVNVEDVPFLMIDFKVDDAQDIMLISNIGDEVVLNQDKQLFLRQPAFTSTLLPYVEINTGLKARLDQHVRSALIELALIGTPDLKEGDTLALKSGGAMHPLGLWEEDA